MTGEELATAADHNLREAWRDLAIGSPSGAVHDDDDITLSATGLLLDYFNVGLVRRHLDDATAVVDRAGRFFDDLGLPWTLRVRDDLAAPVSAAAAAAGMRRLDLSPAMTLFPTRDHAPPPPAGLEILRAGDEQTVAVHVDLACKGFGVPRKLAGPMAAAIWNARDRFVAYVGLLDGEPVACSALSLTPPVAGVYNVATPAEWRRRGLGEALTWHAVAEGARAGCRVATLQASPMGLPIYERMGFRVVASYAQFSSTPGPAA